MAFQSLGLLPWIQETCDSLKMHSPTVIQQKTIPYILKGRNVVGNAPTGSGKTACYCFPMLQQLADDPFSIFGLVLLPSRELTYQVLDQFEVFGNKVNARCQVVTGGFDESQQIHLIDKRRPHILIATPGRLASIIKHPSKLLEGFLSRLKILVLDEADRLLGESLEVDMVSILSCLPKSDQGRQTLLFSATLTRAIKDLNEMSYLNISEVKYPQQLPMIIVDDNPEETPLKNIKQLYLFLNHRIRLIYLHYILSNVKNFIIERNSALESSEKNDSIEDSEEILNFTQKNNMEYFKIPNTPISQYKTQGIIFTATKQQCQLLTTTLEFMGYPVTGLHSLMNQKRRLASLGKFRNHTCKLLVATGVAARGLDIPDVGFVINFDFPRSFEDYIHRIGRTGRAGKEGVVLSFITQIDVPYVKYTENRMNTELELLNLDEDEVLKLMPFVTTVQQKALLLLDEIGFNDKVKETKKRKLEVIKTRNKQKITV
ncbi:DEAD DEAH box helicase family protein [Cryptosporidium andersoni]|uniref:DEAD DEAH box helicase family protein n=1 Tax=Cryptosporidium andersoni TaxID=117008 RepID=A0A1J4MRP0_9CRYT|nr:DEAD DEAH box helicase family protein [Cryptosporidium andersoni]